MTPSIRFGALALAAALAACSPKMRTAPDVKAPQDAASIERGKYLAHNVAGCVDCHSPRDFGQIGGPPVEGKEFSGGTKFDASFKMDGESFPGVLQAPNISQHPEDGIGAWTDGEIARAIREGVRKNGDAMFPMMPYLNYRHLSDEEVLAIVAYLRTIPPREGKTAPRDLNFPLGIIVNFMPRPLEGPVSAPSVTEPVKRGERLATLGGCHDCHSPMDKGEIIKGQELSGGTVVSVAEGNLGTVVISNLTPDPETGLGKVSEAQFIDMMRNGHTKDGKPMSALMPWAYYRGMTDGDLKDLYAYLMSMPPIRKDANARLAEYSRQD